VIGAGKFGAPLLYRAFAAVVCGDGFELVTVEHRKQLTQVSRAQLEVEIGIVQVGRVRDSGLARDPRGRARQELHQAARVRPGSRLRIKVTLLPDERGHQVWIQTVLARGLIELLPV